MAKLAGRTTLTPCVPLSREAGEGEQGARQCAPTPLSHPARQRFWSAEASASASGGSSASALHIPIPIIGTLPPHRHLRGFFTLLLILAFLLPALAQEAVPVPRVSVEVGAARNPQEVSTSLQILAILTLLSVAPSILLMMTAFTRIVIVLSFLKSALGTPNIPPTPVIIGLSLFLTFYVMAPTLDEINRTALQPYMRQQITFTQALERAEKPIRTFMLRQTYTEDLNLFIRLSKQPPPRTADDLPLTTLIPAFMLSELKTAFIIGFYIYIPFLVIDLIVASILLSMGMMMLPPVVVSLPAKLLVFTLANGWGILAQALVQGFR